MAMQFQEIIALPSHIQIFVCSMFCAGIATSSAIFLAHRVPGLQFFPRNGNAIISEKRIAVVVEKLPVWL